MSDPGRTEFKIEDMIEESEMLDLVGRDSEGERETAKESQSEESVSSSNSMLRYIAGSEEFYSAKKVLSLLEEPLS